MGADRQSEDVAFIEGMLVSFIWPYAVKIECHSLSTAR